MTGGIDDTARDKTFGGCNIIAGVQGTCTNPVVDVNLMTNLDGACQARRLAGASVAMSSAQADKKDEKVASSTMVYPRCPRNDQCSLLASLFSATIGTGLQRPM